MAKVDIKRYGSDLPAPMRYEDIDGDFVVLTCSGVREGEAEVENRKKRNVLVLMFKESGDERGLYLNVSQIKTMVEKYGDDSDRWAGMPVPIERTSADFEGKPFKKLAVAAGSDWEELFKAAGVKKPAEPKPGATTVSGGIRGLKRGSSSR